MPNFIAEAVSVTITAATASALTCADTSGLYVGQRGWIVDSGGSNNLEIIVVNVADRTHFSCQKLSSIGNSGNADLSSYNGGTCYFEKQLVEAPGGGADLGTLDTIAVGKVPAKTDTGFANATTANVPDSTDKRYVTDDESDTVGDLTAQQAAGQTDLVTPAARAAAEALAAGTTTLASIVDSTAGAGRKAVTTAESTALALMTAAIGPLARSITVTVPAGGPYSTFDITEWSAGVPLSIPADYGIELEVCSAAGANGWMILRANGGTAAITKGVGQTRGGNFDTEAAYLGVADLGATSKVSAKIGPYTNGSRLFVSNTVDDGSKTHCGSTRAGVAVGTITSLGVGSLSGTSVAVGSTICVRIAKDIRP